MLDFQRMEYGNFYTIFQKVTKTLWGLTCDEDVEVAFVIK